MATPNMPVGKRLVQRRVLELMLRRRTMNQAALAARLDVAPTMVSRWMTGRVVMTCYWVQRVSVALALSHDESMCLVAAAARLDYERTTWGFAQKQALP